MKGYDKPLTKEQLMDELVQMCQRIVELEASETTRQRNRVLNLLNQAGQGFTATLDLEQVAEQLLPAATDIIGAEGASIWLRVQTSPWNISHPIPTYPTSLTLSTKFAASRAFVNLL